MNKEPSQSNSASLSSDLSSTTFQKSRDDYSTTPNKANQLRSIFIIDNSRTKSSINPRIASIQQSDHVTTQFMDKEHILLGNQRCAHQLSLLRNTQQRASSDNTKEECKRTNNERQIRIIFLIGIATHKLLVNKISSSRANNFVFITHHVRLPLQIITTTLMDSSRAEVQSQTLLVTKQRTYVGVYMRPHVHTNICLRKETLHNFYLPQQANSLMENNCQNSPQVSTHKANMPHGSLLVGTPTTPISLSYEYNWEERGVLAIKFSYGDLASVLKHLHKPNLASTNIKLVVELEDRSGNKFRVQLPFPRDIQYKSYDELVQMESHVNVDPQHDS